ncbi:hypothetical protein B0T25DRAFT_565029 [Lasiosphaeria hispida]|uniref:Uncharacterized protein n=1 Tax=Lasiosphaeria hispida TaxID=260671 RepID=A0AAJ0HRV3_9PEZI|nr:hypothetical protein B0T25DRAFT_565029 [Lasiosphaeria hispida]
MSSPLTPLDPGCPPTQGPPNPGATTPTPPTPGRILDRKIERRAIPHSFSSNLGQKSPSPGRSSPLTKPPGKSVRAIVNWLEQAASSPRGPEPSKPQLVTTGSPATAITPADASVPSGDNDVFDNRDARTNTAVAGGEEKSRKAWKFAPAPLEVFSSRPTTVTRPFIRDEYQGEDYSLTLLKYKAYFNNRPLGRCLDYLEQALEEKKTKTDTNKMEESLNIQQQPLVPATARDTQPSSPAEMLDKLMQELQALDFEKDAGKRETCEKRDPEEVKAFWDNVRAQLWIDDGEVYGDASSAEDSEKGEKKMTPDDDEKDDEKGKDEEHGEDEPSPNGSSFPTYEPDEPKPAPCPVPTRLPPPPPTPVLTGQSFSEHDMVFQHEPFPSWDLSSPSVYSSASSPGLRPPPRAVTEATPAVFTSLEDMYPEPELPSSFYTSQGGLPSSPLLAPTRHDDPGIGGTFGRNPTIGNGDPTAPRHIRSRAPSSIARSRAPSAAPRPRAPSSVYSRHDSDPIPPRHAATPPPLFLPALPVSSTHSAASSLHSRPVTPSLAPAPAAAAATGGGSRKSSLSTVRSAHTFGGVRQGLRRMTTEEKIDEIDAFFQKGGE